MASQSLLVSKEFNSEEINKLYSKITNSIPALPKELKYEQSVSIHAIISGKDLLALLPTGFGKSLIFTAPGIIIAANMQKPTCTIIVSPLISLIEDSSRRLYDSGLRAMHVKDQFDRTQEFLDSAKADEAMYLFISPETMASRDAKDLIIKANPVLIAVDEGHLVSEWGKHFRKEYSTLHEVRCLVDCPVGVFTATLTTAMEEEIVRKVGLRKSMLVTVTLSPDRPNIFLETRTGGKKFENLEFLSREVAEKKRETDKTLIFVPTSKMMADLFVWFQENLDEFIVCKEGGKAICYLVNMYSASTEREAKDEILHEFVKPSSFIRILICTVAYGMGVDNPNIRRVVMFGLPSSRLLLLQEIGRAGRDGLRAEAIIFPFTTPQAQNESYELPKDKCLRFYLLEPFGTPGIRPPITGVTPPLPINTNNKSCPLCSCCTVCRNNCDKNCIPGVCWP